MRIAFGLLLALPLTLLARTDAAQAQNYPWCAQYLEQGAARNCGFSTYQQCAATVSGNGGYCDQNPMYRPELASAPRRPRR